MAWHSGHTFGITLPLLRHQLLLHDVAEMTDLSAEDRDYLLSWVWKVEQAMREVAMPDKINLASLGNMVPHLHWHLIARYQTDRHFPAPIWAPAPDRPYQRPNLDAATQDIFIKKILDQ